MMPITLILPADRPGSATHAGLAAQIEAGLARIIVDRRTGRDRRLTRQMWEHGHRGPQRRQAAPLPVSARIVVTA